MFVLFLWKMLSLLTLVRNLWLNMMGFKKDYLFNIFLIYIQLYRGCEYVYRPLSRHIFSHGVVALTKYYLNSFALQTGVNCLYSKTYMVSNKIRFLVQS
jgi:hypothetical protein